MGLRFSAEDLQQPFGLQSRTATLGNPQLVFVVFFLTLPQKTSCTRAFLQLSQTLSVVLSFWSPLSSHLMLYRRSCEAGMAADALGCGAVSQWSRPGHSSGPGASARRCWRSKAGQSQAPYCIAQIMRKHQQWRFAVMVYFKCVSALPASLLMHSVKECFGGCC